MNFNPNNLCYYMAKLFAEYKDSEKKLVICNEGGTRSSKTWDAYHLIVLICDHQRNQWNEIYILRDTLVNCRDFTLKEFIKCLQTIGIYDRNLLTTSPKPYYNLFGNHIFFRGLDDEINTEGYPSDIIFVNEALETSKGSVDGLKMRCRKMMIMDWNPKYVKHWAFNLEGQPDVYFTHTTYKNNKHLEKSIVTEIESYEPTAHNIEMGTSDPFRWKVYGQGLRAANEQLIFPIFHKVDELPKEYDKRIFGLDFGYSHDPAAIVEILFSGNNIYVQEHLYSIGKSNEELAKILKPLVGNCIVICDSAEPKSIAELRKHGINARPCVKGKDSIKFGIKSLKTKRIFITKNSLNLDDELTGYMWKKEKDGTISDIPEGADHLIDALRYGFTYVISIKKIIV